MPRRADAEPDHGGVSEGGVVSPEAMFQGQPLTGRSFEPGDGPTGTATEGASTSW